MSMDEMRLREAIQRDYGELSDPMTLDEFSSMLDTLDEEDEED